MSFWMCVHHFLNCFHVSIISTFFSTLEPIPGVVEWELRYTWTGHTQTGTAGGGGRHQRLFLLRSNSANCCSSVSPSTYHLTDHHSWDSAELHTQSASQTAQVRGSANSSSAGGPHWACTLGQWHTALTIAVVVMTSFYVFLTTAELLGECEEL